jgi:hypothetical protein
LWSSVTGAQREAAFWARSIMSTVWCISEIETNSFTSVLKTWGLHGVHRFRFVKLASHVRESQLCRITFCPVQSSYDLKIRFECFFVLDARICYRQQTTMGSILIVLHAPTLTQLSTRWFGERLATKRNWMMSSNIKTMDRLRTLVREQVIVRFFAHT